MRVRPFPADINESVLASLNEKLIRAKKAYATIAFFTLSESDLSPGAWESLNMGSLCVDINYPTDLDKIDSLHKKVNFHLYLFRTSNMAMKKEFKTPPSRFYKRPRYKLHSKFILLDYPDGISEVIVGSHNWTISALRGGNIEQSVSIVSDTDSQIIEEFRTLLKQVELKCESYDSSKLNDYKNLQLDEDSDDTIDSLEISDVDNLIENSNEFILASKKKLPRVSLRQEIKLIIGSKRYFSIVEKLTGKGGTEATMEELPVAVWLETSCMADPSLKSIEITSSNDYDYYHILKPKQVPITNYEHEEPIKEEFWDPRDIADCDEAEYGKISDYSNDLGLHPREIYFAPAKYRKIQSKGGMKGPFRKTKK